MRKMFAPVAPTLSLCAVMAGILVVAVPVVKVSVDAIFTLLGY
jgi:hypothetical protein